VSLGQAIGIGFGLMVAWELAQMGWEGLLNLLP
jgi:hypothetical protein